MGESYREYIRPKEEKYPIKKLLIEKLYKINDFNLIKKEYKNEIFSSSFNLIKNLENNLEKDYLSKIFQNPTFKLPSKPLVTRFPSVSPVPSFVEHSLSPDDYGYTHLRSAADRRELLDRMVEVLGGMDIVRVNAMVFCDRGARPLATLAAQLWGAISDRPMPAVFFINTDPKHRYKIDASDIPDDVMDQVREWLASEHPDGENPFREGEAVVCVLDEIKGAGRSADFVANIVRRAFPGQVRTVYTEWAGVHGGSRPWRDRSDMIGAETVHGSFRSRELDTEQARMLTADLVRLAQSYQVKPKVSS